MLSTLRPESILAAPAGSANEAQALLAGLWLWHDWLDESHTISQAIETPTGSFWHAILHRREGDFSNAKYWYARCRHHPALASVAAAGRTVVDRATDLRLERLVRGEWDPSAFVDVVEAIHDKPGDPLYSTAVALQRAEWKALFDHCARVAAGR
jgi:hypothetical protein